MSWKFLLVASIMFFIASGLSFREHLKTPMKKRTEGDFQPFTFFLLIASGTLLASILFFFLEK